MDTDIALGAEAGDVDDGFALAAVIRVAQAGRVNLLGVSVADGNTDAATAFDCGAGLLKATDFNLPVTTAGEAAHAIAALPPGTHLLCLGPLTNLAAALRLAPDLPQRIRVSAVIGVHRLWPRVWLPLLDLNHKRDREAWCQVRMAGFKLKRFPLDVVQRLRFGPTELSACEKTGAFGAYLSQRSQRWLRVARLRHLSVRFPVWDLVAALDAIGELPGDEWSDGVLTAFDAGAARERFLDLL